jgi:hypothetical protein
MVVCTGPRTHHSPWTPCAWTPACSGPLSAFLQLPLDSHAGLYVWPATSPRIQGCCINLKRLDELLLFARGTATIQLGAHVLEAGQ